MNRYHLTLPSDDTSRRGKSRNRGEGLRDGVDSADIKVIRAADMGLASRPSDVHFVV